MPGLVITLKLGCGIPDSDILYLKVSLKKDYGLRITENNKDYFRLFYLLFILEDNFTQNTFFKKGIHWVFHLDRAA